MSASRSTSRSSKAKRPCALDDYWNLASVVDVQCAVDGQTAYVVRSVARERNERRSVVRFVGPDAAPPLGADAAESFDETPRWSPDGRMLVVASAARVDAPRRLVFIDARTRQRRPFAQVADSASTPAWSPDGTRVCFAAAVASAELAVAGEVAWYAAHPAAQRSAPLRRQRSLRGRVDGAGYHERSWRLFIASADGEVAPLGQADGPVDDLDPAWSPDGRSIAFVSTRSSDERIVAERDLWVVEVASGRVRRLTHGFWLGGPLAWSPDSRQIACIGTAGLHVPLALRLWLVGVDGSGAVAASPGFGAHLWPTGAPVWLPDGERVIVAAGFGDSGQIIAYDRRSGENRSLVRVRALIGNVQIRADGVTFVATASAPDSPSRLVTGRLGVDALETLVDVNAGWFASVAVAPTRTLRVVAPDGLTIEGWLTVPTSGGAPYPCVLDVHYGPNAAWGPAFDFNAQSLAERGFATLKLNPRGSTGYGDAFAAAADYGRADFADLLLGLDALVAEGTIDGGRLGIMGLSYGGFMANWAITQTQRFRAAVSINGISNQLTWYLLSDTGLFFYRERFGDPFADAAALETYWRHSPLAGAASIQTPLLLLQSENDYRCPIDQGEQLFGALVARGKTVELVRVPNAAHDLLGTAAPLHAYLAQSLAIGWFERYV